MQFYAQCRVRSSRPVFSITAEEVTPPSAEETAGRSNASESGAGRLNPDSRPGQKTGSLKLGAGRDQPGPAARLPQAAVAAATLHGGAAVQWQSGRSWLILINLDLLLAG
jgi:hypothetical protein